MKRFNILVIPGYKLFPIDSGGAHHQLVYLDRLQKEHEIEIVVTPRNLPAEHLERFRKKFPQIKLQMVGFEKSTMASRWAAFFRKQINKLLRRGYPYTIKKTKELRSLVLRDHELIRAILEISQSKKYDIIQVEHTINMGLIELLPKEPVRLFVHHEIAHSRIRMDLEATGYSSGDVEEFSIIAEELELNWLQQYDGIITLSKEDKDLLQQKGIVNPVQAAHPFAYFSEELEKIYVPEQPPQLVFAGGESHFPNKEGLTWFLQDVHPLIGNKPKLLVTGRWTDVFIKQNANPSIEFTGFIEDISTVLRNGILIIPIRIGSGIRVKALTALGYGCPVVSTSFAVAGIPGLIHNENILVADQPEQFAKEIERLLIDGELRKKISDRSFDLAQREFHNALFVKERNMFYQELIDG